MVFSLSEEIARQSLLTALYRAQERVLKFLPKSRSRAPLDATREEVSLLMKLDHPGIARVFEAFQDAANVYIASEPYYGGDLSHLIQCARTADVPLNGSWLARICKQVAEALAYLHMNRVVHCDVKEMNVMATSRDCVLNSE